MEIQQLITDGLGLVSRVRQEISSIRSCNYTQASLDILDIASFNLASAEDLLNYAHELSLKNNDSAGEKILIACDGIKQVQSMLLRQFKAELEHESKSWYDDVMTNIGACA